MERVQHSTMRECRPPNDQEWQAIMARDRRSDGQFVWVALTTSIYWRPSCPARHPQRSNAHIVSNAADAERQGYSACRRCQPATNAPPLADSGVSVEPREGGGAFLGRCGANLRIRRTSASDAAGRAAPGRVSGQGDESSGADAGRRTFIHLGMIAIDRLRLLSLEPARDRSMLRPCSRLDSAFGASCWRPPPSEAGGELRCALLWRGPTQGF